MAIAKKQGSDLTRLIVCERTGKWASALCRTLPDQGRWIFQTRSLKQLRDAASSHPISLILIEVRTRNLLAAAEMFEQLRRSHPRCHLIAAAGNRYHGNRPATSLAEWVLREIGVSQWIWSQRQIAIVCRLWSRHCRLHPPVEQTLRQQIVQGLPWSDA